MSSLAAREPQLSHYAASKRRGEAALAATSPSLRWTVLRPPAVYGPGERELAPLFRWIARGVAPLPSGAAGRFSLLYVDDLAQAVLRWLEADAGDGRVFELDDGRPGGYDWDAVLVAAARVLHGKRPVRRIAVPGAILRVVAHANLAAASLLGYAPMLTPGKLREISHPDWLCDSHDFAEATGWRATVLLEQGLARAYGRQGPGTI
jgi:nucleoside-diphosphate-sugar epimerase